MQQDLVKARIVHPQKVEEFQTQLEMVLANAPEFSGSPFLLAHMIAVFQKHGHVPSNRADLYQQAVELIIDHCIRAKCATARGSTDFQQTGHSPQLLEAAGNAGFVGEFKAGRGFGGVNLGEVANQVCLLCQEGPVQDRMDAESDDSDIDDHLGEVKDTNGQLCGVTYFAHPSGFANLMSMVTAVLLLCCSKSSN
eukprot:3686002-Rhodomonas_salina.1